MKCKCGSDRFMAHQVCRHDVIIDGHGAWIEDKGVYDSETPYEPFTCMVCGHEYNELPSTGNKEIAAVMLKKMLENKGV